MSMEWEYFTDSYQYLATIIVEHCKHMQDDDYQPAADSPLLTIVIIYWVQCEQKWGI